LAVGGGSHSQVHAAGGSLAGNEASPIRSRRRPLAELSAKAVIRPISPPALRPPMGVLIHIASETSPPAAESRCTFVPMVRSRPRYDDAVMAPTRGERNTSWPVETGGPASP